MYVLNDMVNKFQEFKRSDLHKHKLCLFIAVLRNSSHKKLLIVLQCDNMIKDLDCRRAHV